MEEKIDKLYELMERMYVDLKGDISGINSRLDGVEGSIKKLQLTQEQMQTKLETMAEVQESHFEGQNRINEQILSKLDRLETATLENEAQIYNLKKVK